MNKRPIIAETSTPDGMRVVLFEDTWLLHILNPHDGHPEFESHLKAVLDTVQSPDYRQPENWPDRERFFKRGAGPTRWLMVVVDSEKEPARVVTAFGYRHGRSPDGWTP